MVVGRKCGCFARVVGRVKQGGFLAGNARVGVSPALPLAYKVQGIKITAAHPDKTAAARALLDPEPASLQIDHLMVISFSNFRNVILLPKTYSESTKINTYFKSSLLYLPHFSCILLVKQRRI